MLIYIERDSFYNVDKQTLFSSVETDINSGKPHSVL